MRAYRADANNMMWIMLNVAQSQKKKQYSFALVY